MEEAMILALAQTFEKVQNRNLDVMEKMSNQIELLTINLDLAIGTIHKMQNHMYELEKEIEELNNKEEEENMDPTIKMCNEVVEAVEKGNNDDFLASYMKLTESLKAEVREDIANEQEYYCSYDDNGHCTDCDNCMKE